MDMFWAFTILSVGVLLLWKGADLLVTGAVSVAERFGISPLIIGLTIVAMGTSAPEVATSIAAVLKPEGGGDVALGNICGSNIANLALVGGIIALIHPMLIKKQVLLREFPVMIAGTLVLWPILADGHVSRPEASILLCLFIGILLFTIVAAMRQRAATVVLEDSESHANDSSKPAPSLADSLLRICLGLTGLIFGADLVIKGATTIGEWLGLSDAVVGIVFVAVGTSLPELVTCVVAATKGHHDMSIGNLVGSNVFNALLVTGCAGLASPFDVGGRFAGGRDYLAMLGTSLLFWGIAIAGRGTIGRVGGSLLLLTYVGYILYTIVVGSG